MRKIIYPPDTLVKFPSVFGDGSDGDVVISSDTTLTRDMYYENLTVNSGIVLTTDGFKVFVRNVLKKRGTIRNNGADAVADTPGNGAPAGSLAGGGKGGAGQASSYTDGAAGTLQVNSLGGDGGAGGAGTFDNGGAGGVTTDPTSGFGSAKDFVSALTGRSAGQPFIKGFYEARRTTDQAISNNSETYLIPNTVVTDQGSIISHDTSSSIFTVLRAGLYLVSAVIGFTSNATGIRILRSQLNNVEIPGGGSIETANATDETVLRIDKVMNLAVGDEVVFTGFQLSTIALNMLGTVANYTRSSASFSLLSDDSVSYSGGGGGGGGGGKDFTTSGGGGGGGGITLIAANILDNAGGVIEAKGGAGADGGAAGAGGGGGGGGGVIILLYSVLVDGTTDVTGGAFGTATGAGEPGVVGSDGQVISIKAL